MLFSTYVLSVFFISLSFLGYAHCQNPPLTKFGKKAKKLIPKENFDKVFAANYQNDDELAKAVKEGSKNFYMVLGLPFNENAVEKVEDDNENIGDSNITPELLFHANTYAISKALKKFGILNHDNINDLAQKFADQVNDAAKNLDKDDIVSTFKAMTTAVAKFLKSQGINTKDQVNQFTKYYFQELNKYQKNGSFLGSLIGGLLNLL